MVLRTWWIPTLVFRRYKVDAAIFLRSDGGDAHACSEHSPHWSYSAIEAVLLGAPIGNVKPC